MLKNTPISQSNCSETVLRRLLIILANWTLAHLPGGLPSRGDSLCMGQCATRRHLRGAVPETPLINPKTHPSSKQSQMYRTDNQGSHWLYSSVHDIKHRVRRMDVRTVHQIVVTCAGVHGLFLVRLRLLHHAPQLFSSVHGLRWNSFCA